MPLQNIREIDLRTSKIDAEKSDKKKAQYHFIDKQYHDYKNKSVAHPYFFWWCRNEPYAIADAKNKWPGADFLTPKDDYFPEGAEIDANGHFYYKDVVRMKIPIEVYITQRKREIGMSESAPAKVKAALLAELSAHGAVVTDEELDRYMGKK